MGLFFLVNIGQENLFYNILERKNAVLGLENKKFKKSKNWDFPKGVNPWFWSKNCHFFNFFFRHYRPGKCVWDTLERKNAFLLYKNQEVKMSKNWDFCKGVDWWFLWRICFFPIFFFFELIYSRKGCFRIFYNNKALFSAINRRSLKSRKIEVFSKLLIHGFF